jgi:peptide/nickel transport system substrate-binding protein
MAVPLGTDSAASVKDLANVVSYSSGTMNAIYMQPEGSKAGPLADKRVRQAMIQAVDRDSIVKNIMGGLVDAATQSVPQNVVGYNPAVKQLPYDVNKAQALMAQAGVKPFDIEMGANYGGFVNTKQVAEAYQAFESKIGVNIKISALELSAYLQDFRSYNRPPIWNQYLAWTPNLDASLQFQWFLSSKGPDKFMNNQDFDRLYKQAAGELDEAKRTKELQDAEASLVDEAIAVYLYENPSIYGVSKKVQGFSPRPDSVIDTFKLTRA